MMKMERLHEMEDSARVWIFQSSKLLTGDLLDQIRSELDTFLQGWAAHGRELFSGFAIENDRFIVIAVDEAMAQATGCSIDGMMKVVQQIDAAHDLDLLNRMKVAYEADGNLVECDMNAFTRKIESGLVSEDTVVYNNLVETLGDFRRIWRTQLSNSWHAQLLTT